VRLELVSFRYRRVSPAHSHYGLEGDYNGADPMPFFFILPIWAVAVVASLVLLSLKRSRTVGMYLLFTATGGLIFSFALSTAALLAGARLLGGTNLGWLTLLVYLAMIGVGAVLGIAVGALAARKLTARR
jgi:hypothetical protein